MVGRTTSFRRKPPQRVKSSIDPGSKTPSLELSNSGRFGRLNRAGGSARSILRTSSSDSVGSGWSRRNSDDSFREDPLLEEGAPLLKPTVKKTGKRQRPQSFRLGSGASFRSTSSANSFRVKDEDTNSYKCMFMCATFSIALCSVGSLLIQSYFLLGIGRKSGAISLAPTPSALSPLLVPQIEDPQQRNGTSTITESLTGGNEISPLHGNLTEKRVEGLTSKYKGSILHPRHKLEEYVSKFGTDSIRKVITAYTEAPMNDVVPGTGSRDNPDDKNFGKAPEFVVPLPLRTQTPDMLQQHLYPKAKTCHDLPASFPVDRGIQLDGSGNPILWNTGSDPVSESYPQEEAEFCPVELDPFLPWYVTEPIQIGGTLFFLLTTSQDT